MQDMKLLIRCVFVMYSLRIRRAFAVHTLFIHCSYIVHTLTHSHLFSSMHMYFRNYVISFIIQSKLLTNHSDANGLMLCLEFNYRQTDVYHNTDIAIKRKFSVVFNVNAAS